MRLVSIFIHRNDREALVVYATNGFKSRFQVHGLLPWTLECPNPLTDDGESLTIGACIKPMKSLDTVAKCMSKHLIAGVICGSGKPSSFIYVDQETFHSITCT
jgi:hypothetical protein